jgi:hypothetical protein
MSSTTDRRHERWANLRHSIIGALLAAPPRRGELRAAIEALADKTYRHPVTGEPVRFAFSTLEPWLHLARKAGHGDDSPGDEGARAASPEAAQAARQ